MTYIQTIEGYCSYTGQYLGPRFYITTEPIPEHNISHGASVKSYLTQLQQITQYNWFLRSKTDMIEPDISDVVRE